MHSVPCWGLITVHLATPREAVWHEQYLLLRHLYCEVRYRHRSHEVRVLWAATGYNNT